MPKFTADWIVEGSFQETLQKLIEKAEPGALAGMSPEQITDALIDELRFISLYSEQEEQEVEEYLRRRAQYGHEVISHIALQLQQLGADRLRRIAHALATRAEEQTTTLDLAARPEVLAVATAAQMVSFPDVVVVIRYLMGLMGDLEQKEKEKVANIVTHLLPFNYAPGLIRELTEKVTKGQLGLVPDSVATHTLAEAIMAGYDGKRVKYARHSMRGETAIEVEEEPEEGPGDSRFPRLSVLRAARNFLIDLLTLKGTVLEGPKRARPGAVDESEEEVLSDIRVYAQDVRGLLKSLSTLHGDRSVYCVLQLPEQADRKQVHQRAFRIEVLREVARHVRELLFVELVRSSSRRELEAELTGYLKFIHAHVLPL